ncbi:hypothetical protein HNO89_002520 [Sporosarcina luteola]|nr:hypothetical protein [Sporosarcina luteola]
MMFLKIWTQSLAKAHSDPFRAQFMHAFSNGQHLLHGKYD